MTGPQPHSWIETLAPYKPGRSKTSLATSVKLSSNESVTGPSPKAIAALHAAAGDIYRYPDPTATALREALGAYHGFDPDNIICGNGSDEILELLIRAYAGPGDEVIHSRHGFMVYPIATAAVGARPVAVPNKNWAADVDGILDAVTERTRIVFVDNPNNPTGAYLPQGAIQRLLGGLPENIILVLDAAYAECVTAEDYEAGLALVKDAENVVMTRTFSKIYGLAGLRIGWAAGSEKIIQTLHRIRSPFNCSMLAQAAALEALADRAHLAHAQHYNCQWREWLRASLTALGLTVIPSQANFLLVEFPKDDAYSAKSANAFLTRHGYLLRYLPDQGLEHHLRLSIGSEQQNRSLVKLITEFMSNDSGMMD